MTRALKLADKQEYLTGRRQVVKTGLLFFLLQVKPSLGNLANTNASLLEVLE